MRRAGRLAAQVLEMIGDHVLAGATTQELNDICHRYIVEALDCVPAPLNYTNSPQQQTVTHGLGERGINGPLRGRPGAVDHTLHGGEIGMLDECMTSRLSCFDDEPYRRPLTRAETRRCMRSGGNRVVG